MSNTILLAGICLLLLALQCTTQFVDNTLSNDTSLERLGQPLAQYGNGNYGNYGNGYGGGDPSQQNYPSSSQNFPQQNFPQQNFPQQNFPQQNYDPYGSNTRYGASNEITGINTNPFYDATNPLSSSPGRNSYDSNFNTFGNGGGTSI